LTFIQWHFTADKEVHVTQTEATQPSKYANGTMSLNIIRHAGNDWYEKKKSS